MRLRVARKASDQIANETKVGVRVNWCRFSLWIHQ
jgi:hypothetical protein